MELYDKIVRVINGYRHKNFNHTVSKAKTYNQIVTGCDQGELVVSYKPNESPDQKAQRVEIYKTETTGCVHQVMTQYDFVKGAPRISESISFTRDVQKSVVSSLENDISAFYGGQTLQQYLETQARLYCQIDPNAWLLIVEREPSPTVEQTKAIPIVITSDCALDFVSTGGITDYLVVCAYTTEQRWDASVVYSNPTQFVNYYGYEKSEVIAFVEANDKNPSYQAIKNPEQYEHQSVKGKTFCIVRSVYTTYTFTHAMRMGYTPDDKTKGVTYVGIFHPVEDKMKDLINAKSEYDLTRALHTFLKQYIFTDVCDYTVKDETGFDRCNGGVLSYSNQPCPKCKGSGVKAHTTTQDVIMVKRPSHDEPTPVKLSEMVHYASMPFDIVNHQAQYIEKIKSDIPKIMFGVDLNARTSGMKTATEISNFFDSVYMVISAFAEKISQLYVFSVRCIAEIKGISEKVNVTHRYPKTFKMETVSELMTMRELAEKSGASGEIIWGIDLRISEIQNRDSPMELEIQRLKHRYRPFKDISKVDRTVLMADLPIDNDYKILYNFLDVILDRIVRKKPNFTLIPMEEQDKAIKEEVEAIKKELKPINPTLGL